MKERKKRRVNITQIENGLRTKKKTKKNIYLFFTLLPIRWQEKRQEQMVTTVRVKGDLSMHKVQGIWYGARGPLKYGQPNILENEMGSILLAPCSSAFSADATSKLDVLGHDGDTLGVDGAQVSVFKESNKVGFGSLLECEDGHRLEAEISLVLLGNLTDETLEGELADQELGGLLVPADLTKSNGSGPVAVGLLDASGGGGSLAGSLGG